MKTESPRHISKRARWLLVALAVVLTALAWVGVKLLWVPNDSLRVQLTSDKPISGFISYSTVDFGLRSGERSIAPEQVKTAQVAQREVTATVTPTGEANPKSGGKEVWLYDVSSEYETFGGSQWAEMQLPDPWTTDATTALNAAGAPVPLSVGLKAGAYVDFRLVTHPWSGKVRLEAGGESRIVDLFAKASSENVFRVLLPTSGEMRQRIDAYVPATARDMTLEFTGGPRVVRLGPLERRGSTPWTWNPSRYSDMRLGQGVKVLSRDADSVSLRIEGPTGSVSYPNARTGSYWVPQLGDLARLAGLAFIVAGFGLIGLACVGLVRGLRTAVSGLRRPRDGSALEGSNTPKRQRLVDGILLFVASMWLLVGVAGAILVVADVTMTISRPETVPVIDDSVPNASLHTSVFDWAVRSPAFGAWWGSRPRPMPDGGDSLRVLSRRSVGHSLGSVMGTVVSREQREGVYFKQVLIPQDTSALLGYEPVTVGYRADGSSYRSPWPGLEEYASAYVDVPFVKKDYDPVLTESQLEAIQSTTDMTPQTGAFSLGRASDGASGFWILHSVASTPRRYLLVPLEVSPLGPDR